MTPATVAIGSIGDSVDERHALEVAHRLCPGRCGVPLERVVVLRRTGSWCGSIARGDVS